MKNFQVLRVSLLKVALGFSLGLLVTEIKAQTPDSSANEPPTFSTKEDLGLRFEKPDFSSARTLAHKIFSRMSGGLISNVGTSSGSTFTYGGANLGGAFFLREDLALGAAYKIESNFSRVPLKGWDIWTRYYYLGAGTVVKVSDGIGDHVVRQNTWNPYAGVEFSSRDYVFVFDPTASDPADQSLTGAASAANVIVGLDYRLNRHWEANVEMSYTILPFGGTDTRVKIKWILVSFGMNYVF